jgi:hypothetical protein
VYFILSSVNVPILSQQQSVIEILMPKLFVNGETGAMPKKVTPLSRLHVHPASDGLTKESLIGAEIYLDGNSGLVDPKKLSVNDIAVLRQALYDYSVLVLRNQQGISPQDLPLLAAIWDDKIKQTHSGGEKQVKDSNNILSKNGGARIPKAPQVQVIGNGEFIEYEDIEYLNLAHVVDNSSLMPDMHILIFSRTQQTSMRNPSPKKNLMAARHGSIGGTRTILYTSLCREK